MTTRKYKYPPITEAVFEIFFQAENWSPATPGAFYSLVKDQYPIITQSGNRFDISLGSDGVRIGSGNNNLTQFKSKDNSSIIQLSNNLMTVNKLPLYTGWESYSKMIHDAVKHLHEVLIIKEIKRVGLRTINKIDITSHTYENFRKSFNAYPHIPDNAHEHVNSIQLNYEAPLNKSDEVLSVNLNTLKSDKEYKAPVLFQLYYTKLNGLKISNLNKWLDEAHYQINNTFEKVVTVEQKKAFDDE